MAALLSSKLVSEKDIKWVQFHKDRVSEIFELYDEGRGYVRKEHVPVILRSLGIFTTEEGLLEIFLSFSASSSSSSSRPSSSSATGSGRSTGADNDIVSYEKLEHIALELLASRKWEPDSSDLVLQAFRAIDTEKLGYIPVEKLKKILCSRGDAFFEKEIETFISIAKDPETGHVYYEDYVALLSKYSQMSESK